MLACNFTIQKFFIKVQGIKINLIFFSRGKLKGENKMSINNVSNFYGKDYATEFGKKWEAQINENQKQLSGMGVTVPIGQSVDKKPELTGLQVEKSDVTAEKIDRELTSDKAIKQAEKEAQKAFVEYGSEDGKKVSEKDAKKLAKNYVENEQHKEEVKGKIYGTNARCLLKLLGTPFMPDLKDAVLFLEGFHSNIIQWNAMLEQYNQDDVPHSCYK